MLQRCSKFADCCEALCETAVLSSDMHVEIQLHAHQHIGINVEGGLEEHGCLRGQRPTAIQYIVEHIVRHGHILRQRALADAAKFHFFFQQFARVDGASTNILCHGDWFRSGRIAGR